MKRSIQSRILSASIFVLIGAVLAPISRADSVEDAVSEIRSRYNAIEKAPLRSQSIRFEADDEPLSGTATLYFEGDQLVKIHLSYVAGDHGGSDEYFYYRNGALFFAYASDSFWRFSGNTLPNGESETTDTVVEHRAYFSSGTLIRHLVKEAESSNPEALPTMLAKTENKPSQDSERAARLIRFGTEVFKVRNSAELGRLLTAG